MEEGFTKKMEIQRTKKGYLFSFFCDLCDFCVTTDEISGLSYKQANLAAQKHGKYYFNMCHSCGAWVCDKHYDIDEMRCVHCSPKKLF